MVVELSWRVGGAGDVDDVCLSAGSVLRCDVVGRILMKCFLSDMPELRLGLNEKLEDVTFHQCVNLSTFEAQKVVTFIPPDGEFELMRCVQASSRAVLGVLAAQAYTADSVLYPGLTGGPADVGFMVTISTFVPASPIAAVHACGL